MSEQQETTSVFNKDVDSILSQHEKDKNDQGVGGSNRGRGKGKSNQGRGRGGRRGRGGTTTARQTRSVVKGKIREPVEVSAGEEQEEEGSELTESSDDREKEVEGEAEEVKEKTYEEDDVDEDTISLEDKAAFVKENTHIKREHERYIEELTRQYRKGNTGRHEILERSYLKWCERFGSEPRSIKMLAISSDEEDEEEACAGKRKAKDKSSDKPAKVGKKMETGRILTHKLIDLAPYWDSKMKACFGYVPLTIFVPAWLLEDKNHMSNRRKQSSSCSDVVAYVGLKVPSEWQQSFLMWSTSFNLYVQYWRLKYGREDIASRLEEHYKIVLSIKAKCHEAFAPALRYDITHRTNLLAAEVSLTLKTASSSMKAITLTDNSTTITRK
ncbi:uncharacterized protein MELLADRAFT_108720 [Melampsora larici-populina 98AG31]|uniref:Uncharacterized protein n=1 Tax=Melampsora larici-populina (strain 98AG31 / pathotype 3-4-7) TaxID=747676 RepID=F4RU12_MELLP|nr:uncharacterized protein MELLADRAFT_108720 [Melampsora larici-populina 98AG31]EGG04165.1 hypothetical protein MELLADRAFT_108720 [Melampsora larici-populina 98AG31]